MRRSLLVGSICFLAGAMSLAFAQTMRPDQFVAAPWTWTGIQIFADGKLSLAGLTSGNSILKAPATGGGTVTLPSGTGTLSFGAGGGGGVTSVTCGAGLSGGTITGTGTCALNLASPNTWLATQIFGPVIAAVSTQSGTTYALSASDCGTTIRFTSATAVTVTTLAAAVVGCAVAIQQTSAGQVTIVNGGSATMNSADGFTKTAGPYAIIGLFVDANPGGSAAHYVLTGRGA
jgi:hypothetical protein